MLSWQLIFEWSLARALSCLYFMSYNTFVFLWIEWEARNELLKGKLSWILKRFLWNTSPVKIFWSKPLWMRCQKQTECMVKYTFSKNPTSNLGLILRICTLWKQIDATSLIRSCTNIHEQSNRGTLRKVYLQTLPWSQNNIGREA